MKNDRVLKRIVLLQAVCLILLALIVVYRVLLPPKAASQLPAGDGRDHHDDASGGQSDLIAARVGGVPITVKELNDQLRLQYGDSVLRTLMVRAAIRLEADAFGLQTTAAELADKLAAMSAGYGSLDEYFAALKEQLGLSPDEVREDTGYQLLLEKIAVRKANVREAEVDAYIADNEAEFSAHTQLRISWIVTNTKEEAEGVLRKLAAGQSFALMAKTYSTDTDTAADGGDLGFIEKDDPIVNQNMLQAAKKLAVGGIAGPISVDNGQTAVIHLTEKKTEQQLDGQQLRDKARRELAVSKLNGQRAIEDDLLAKYNAVVIP